MSPASGPRTLTRREFVGALGASTAALLTARCATSPPPNVLLITADDMNGDSAGCYGSTTPDVTPNIDRLASEGMRFVRGHVTIAVCQPSRSVLMTGRYPHRNGATGFGPVRADVPTLVEVLRGAGYRSGCLGKLVHLAPKSKFPWDVGEINWRLGFGRSAAHFERRTFGFIEEAKREGRPFFLMANSSDPHRPFPGSRDEEIFIRRFAKSAKRFGGVDVVPKIPAPSRSYGPDEVAVPGFLPDLPEIRAEVAGYYSGVRRCDDIVGGVLRALDRSGLRDSTLVLFLSDNGMPFPFSKDNCYLDSTRVPWIVRWPGRVRAGAVDSDRYVSGIDLMPTVLDALGVAAPDGMDGRSFLPLLSGGPARGSGRVVTVYHETSMRRRYEMRCLRESGFAYIFNAWSNGRTRFQNESQAGVTMEAMRRASAHSPEIAARVRHFLYREPEELYDTESDPNGLRNLAGDPAHADRLAQSRRSLLAWMRETGDPVAEVFAARARA